MGKLFVLDYDFHIFKVSGKEEVKRKRMCFSKVEELLKAYREKKEALFMGAIPYNDNFKIYSATLEEMDLASIDVLL